MKRHYRYAAAALVVVCTATGAFISYVSMSVRYLADRLPQTEMSVSLDGRVYSVRGRTVTGDDGSPAPLFTRSRAFRMAYAAELLRTQPLLSLEGSDLGLLTAALAELEHVRDALALLQESAEAKRRVSEDLFPLSFLHNVVLLEELRRRALEAPSDAAYEQYENQLTRTIESGRSALAAFRASYEVTVQNEYERTAAPSGLITKSDTLRTLDDMARGYEALAREAKARATCMRGLLFLCEQPVGPDAELPAASRRQEVDMRHVLSLLDAARESRTPERFLVGLDESACRPDVRDVSYIELRETIGSQFLAYAYVGDLLLRRFDGDARGDTLTWFSRQRMTYLPYNPLIFYTCPQVAVDIARARSLVRIAHALEAESDSVIYERETLELLREERLEARGERRAALAALEAEYVARSAGAEDVVNDIVHGLRSSLAMREKGIPTNVSDHLLFATHSGYYSLFLAHNTTALSGNPPPYASDPDGRFFDTFFTYRTARDQVSDEQLVSDLRAFFAAHN